MLVTKNRFNKMVADYESTIGMYEQRLLILGELLVDAQTKINDTDLILEQNENLVNKVKDLSSKVNDVLVEENNKLTEENELLLLQADMLDEILDELMESPNINEELLNAFEEQVFKLPANTAGFCTVRKDGVIQSMKINSKEHAKELLEQFKSGELELVG